VNDLLPSDGTWAALIGAVTGFISKLGYDKVRGAPGGIDEIGRLASEVAANKLATDAELLHAVQQLSVTISKEADKTRDCLATTARETRHSLERIAVEQAEVRGRLSHMRED